LGSIHLRKDGRVFEIDENATGAEAKKIMNLPPDSVLVNARNEPIADNEKISDKVKDGENVVSVPKFIYW
jgi:hypothetical protein